MDMTVIQHAAACAVIGWAVANHLTQSGAILSRYGHWLGKMVEQNRSWVAKPLGYCGKCLSGQLAMWTGFVLLAHVYAITPMLALWKHLFLICLSVVLAGAMDVLKRI